MLSSRCVEAIRELMSHDSKRRKIGFLVKKKARRLRTSETRGKTPCLLLMLVPILHFDVLRIPKTVVRTCSCACTFFRRESK